MRIRFTRLDLHEVRLPFRFAFRHSLADRREAHGLILVLHTSVGPAGYGEVLPRTYLTGETVESAREDIAMRWWPALRAVEAAAAADCRPMLAALRPLYEAADDLGRTAAYGGLDVAAMDAYARAVGVPGGRLFGQTPRRETLSAPLGAGGVFPALWSAGLFRALGFRQFKLKVGGPCDRARALGVRRVIGPRSDLRVDANGAWSAAAAAAQVERLKDAGISSVEQPVASGPSAATCLRHVQQATGVPIMADESLCTRADARQLLGAGGPERVLLWNVRVGKVGGFSGALELLRLAEANGVGVHLGVLVGETAVFAAAQRALFGLTEFTHVEYGFGRLLLRVDPVAGAPDGWRGTGSPLGARPGLGVRLRPEILARVRVRGESLS